MYKAVLKLAFMGFALAALPAASGPAQPRTSSDARERSREDQRVER